MTTMESSQLPNLRTTAIPRFSKLPQPRSFASDEHVSPTKPPSPPSPAANPSVTQTIGTAGNPTRPQSMIGGIRGQSSLQGARPISTYGGNFQRNAAGTAAGTSQRQPLTTSQRPQSKPGPTRPARVGSDESDRSKNVKIQRHASQQENLYELVNSPDDSDASANSSVGNISPVQLSKKPPRPSLADRTVESIAQVPPSTPQSTRRRSSFFNPKSPMSPPQSATSSSTIRVSKLDLGTRRDGGFVRPPSPLKRQGGLPQPSTPVRRIVSGGTAKSAIPTPGSKIAAPLTSPTKRTTSPTKSQSRPTSAASVGRDSTSSHSRSQTLGGIAPKPVQALQSTLRAPTPIKRTDTAMKGPQLARPKSTSVSANKTQAFAGPAVGGSATSSLALRQQIAQAKAANRANNHKSDPSSPADAASYSFENCADPFNQSPKVEDTLFGRLENARRDGFLNIAALALKTIPGEVLEMYDSGPMEASSLSWNEIVDLTRLNAGDNEIEVISDDIFPDVTNEALAEGVEAKGSQFRGVDSVDLRGNALKSVPIGLRRLERLTTLNLSRNKIENSIFDVITQIKSLRSLYLGENELCKDVPDSICQLSNLESLDLHGNKISQLPVSIKDLTALRVLNVSHNRLSDLRIEAIAALPLLVELIASNNALTGALFPTSMTTLPRLQVLEVANNSIAALSFSTNLDLPALQRLDVSRNRLFGLPNMSTWTSMVTLLAEDNGLTALPDGFTRLIGLRSADFTGNSLRVIDPAVASMFGLQNLVLAGNPLIDKKLLSLAAGDVKMELAKKLNDTTAGATM